MSDQTQQQSLGAGSRVNHEEYGVGVLIKTSPTAHLITFLKHGNIELPLSEELDVIERVPPNADIVSLDDVATVLSGIMEKWGGVQEIIPLGDRWIGGTMILKPADDDLKAKEIPIEAFFHKIVMTRDRLRVMEQRINSSDLRDEEKVNLQQYITRIYGSLTTFNVLFKNKEDHFKGTAKQ